MLRTGWLAIGLVLGSLATSAPAQEEIEPEDAEPGILAEYAQNPDGPALAHRVEADLTQRWGDARPDPRLSGGPFAARWSGAILVREPGPHRFFAKADGPVELSISGEAVQVGTDDGDEPETVELPPGLVSIEIRYRHEQGPAYFALEWEGPGFQREPLPAWVLYHDRSRGAARDPFESGRRLADQLGCANCHNLLDLPAHHKLGPPLLDAGHAIDPIWLAAWLTDPAQVRDESRMPGFGDHGLGPGEVADLIAFLRELPKSTPAEPSDVLKMALNIADPVAGQLVFRTTGCLGCHTRESDGIDFSVVDRAAPDLSDLGRKRSADWIGSYLARPGTRTPARHRPDMHLRPDEAAHLAAYLVSNPPDPIAPLELPTGDAKRGRQVAERYRCASCHEIPGLKAPLVEIPLKAGSNPEAGCLASEDRAEDVPRFALRDEQLADLRVFVGSLPESPSPLPKWTQAEDALRRWNCFGCHVRDGQGGSGFGAQIAAYLAQDPELGAFKGRMTPPDLTAVGDKLNPEYLDLSVRGKAPMARPWLSVQMPVFPFETGEAELIVEYLKEHDGASSQAGLTSSDEPKIHPELAAPEQAAGLLGQQGFGCISCHVVAGKIPPGGEPETLGPDLALAHQRMSRRYFRRWIADPQRIIPGTPMPQFLEAVDSQPGSFDEQLDAIWAVLGRKDLEELASFGTREIRRPQGDRAEVVRDMVLVPTGPESTEYYPRGLTIGFGNEQSLLFDTDRLSWVSWWRGGFLSRTKAGRLWEWHPEGTPLWKDTQGAPTIRFQRPDGQVIPPKEIRERFGSFRELRFEGPAIILAYDLNGPDQATVQVVEQIAPKGDGWQRSVRVSGLPEGWQPLLELPKLSSSPNFEEGWLEWTAGDESARLQVEPRLESRATASTMEANGDGTFRASMRLDALSSASSISSD